jgi:hypothetical protein
MFDDARKVLARRKKLTTDPGIEQNLHGQQLAADCVVLWMEMVGVEDQPK